MPVVTPFDLCLARPAEGGRAVTLTQHLENVARNCGAADGDAESRLAFLAGLLHDAAKCHSEWQAYIRGEATKRPSHAPLGAALFAYWAEHLIPTWKHERKGVLFLREQLLDWVRVLYSHHGELEDLDSVPPWTRTHSGEHWLEQLRHCDRSGLEAFVRRHFPHAPSLADFGSWLGEFDGTWEWLVLKRQQRVTKRAGLEPGWSAYIEDALRLASRATVLVKADRYDAGEFGEEDLDRSEAEAGIRATESYCAARGGEALKRGADPRIVRQRSLLQSEALRRYRESPAALFYTLTLPTGFGKTLTAVRVALEACRLGTCRRIVYVAPYLSILSQAASEIAAATGLEVWQHHHLSPLELEDDRDVDALDTWQTPVLATTFNQLFRALFPSRAQECLRRGALRGAFIIVDEPQIIATAVWNLFLKVLESTARRYGAQVVFATATLPPLNYGLDEPWVPLAGKVKPTGRFVIRFDPQPAGPDDCVEKVAAALGTANAVSLVVNTVADAAQVYRMLRDAVSGVDVYCLTAEMLPGHKAAVIRRVRHDLEAGKPLACVSTQILEAGVDLSFRTVLRALPVLPSVAQAAGRANRHGEGQPGTVSVFPFYRQDGVDSRKFVYRDSIARKHTDDLLVECGEIGEEELLSVLNEYYRRCWEQAHMQACLDRLRQAALGEWSALAGVEPFGAEYGQVELFVPWPGAMEDPYVQKAMRTFGVQSPEDILQRVEAGGPEVTTFAQRKRWLSLLHRFTVSVPREVAEEVGRAVTQWLWALEDPEIYAEDTGLAHLRGLDSSGSGTVIL